MENEIDNPRGVPVLATGRIGKLGTARDTNQVVHVCRNAFYCEILLLNYFFPYKDISTI